MIKFINGFVKITGWLAQKIVFRTKVTYEDKNIQSRKIKGKAIIVSNHTSVFDYAAFLFVFFGRTLRYQMAEVLFKKKFLGKFLRMMGGIYVDRDAFNFDFISKSETILSKKGVVGIFPEGRLALPGEQRPLPFKTGAAFLALSTNTKIIPVYTNGKYFSKERARVIIGKPIDPLEITENISDDKAKIEALSNYCRDKVIELEKILSEQTKA